MSFKKNGNPRYQTVTFLSTNTILKAGSDRNITIFDDVTTQIITIGMAGTTISIPGTLTVVNMTTVDITGQLAITIPNATNEDAFIINNNEADNNNRSIIINQPTGADGDFLQCNYNSGEVFSINKDGRIIGTPLTLLSTGNSINVATGSVVSGNMIFQTNTFGTVGQLRWTIDTDEFKFGVGDSVGNQLILTNNLNITKDHDHALTTNPTVFIHSDKDPDTLNTEWLGFDHDQTDANIFNGKGNININPVAGSAVVLDGGASFDGTILTGLTALTSTAITGTLQTASQANITSLGTLTTLTVDSVTINGTDISSSGALSITPTNNLTVSQNSVDVITSVAANAIDNTLYLKEGNLGIGTTSPSHPINVNGAISIIGQNVVHDTSAIVIGQENSAKSQLRAYGPDAFTKGSIEIMLSKNNGDGSVAATFDSFGNLGIGITPTGRLTVDGGTAETDTAGTDITMDAEAGGTDGGTASNGQDGGGFVFTAGNGSNAVTTDADGGDGGNIILLPGTAGAKNGSGTIGTEGFVSISGKVGIGVTPLTNQAVGDIVLEGGSLILKEITTPTADANYGKVYPKADNKLYFQDGAGNEKALLTATGNLAEMTIHENGTALTIDSTSKEHAIRLFSAGDLSGFTFDAGLTGAIANTADNGGTLRITDIAHGLVTGDIVTITGLATASQNDVTIITRIDDDTFDCDDITFATASETGTWNQGSALMADATATGTYLIHFFTSASSASANQTFEWHIYINTTRQEDAGFRRRFSNTDVGMVSGSAIITLAASDILWIAVQNQTNPNNITHIHANMNMHQL